MENNNPNKKRLFKLGMFHFLAPLLIVCFFLSSGRVLAQQGKESGTSTSIKGIVKDDGGLPIIGAYVSVKGTTLGTGTDANGNFSLNVPQNSTISISYIGFVTQELLVKDKTSFDITLLEDKELLKEVVVIGYGKQSKATVTGAVTSMKARDVESIPVGNLSNVLAGRLAGVNVVQQTGLPGTASNIKIRASGGSWNNNAVTAVSPLFVIDGVVRSKDVFDLLDASEISDISVLKDASTAAIYGSIGGSGVILVTTKRGALGKPVLSYSGSYSTEEPVRIPKMVDAVTQMDLQNRFWGEGNINSYTADEYEYFSKRGIYDWYKEAYETPYNTHHTLNVSGGTDRVKYFLSGSIFDQKGFLPNVNFQRYTLRSNVSTKITDNLTAELMLSTNYGENKRFVQDGGAGDMSQVWGKLLYMNWEIPPYINGLPVRSTWLGNVVEMMRNGGYHKQSSQFMDATMSLEYKIPYISGLSVKGQYSKNIRNTYVKQFDKKHEWYSFKTEGGHNHITTDIATGVVSKSSEPGRESLYASYDKADSYQFTGQVSYVKSFGKHNFDAIALYEVMSGFNANFSGRRYDFPILVKDQWFATSSAAADSRVSGEESKSARVAYVGRLNYNYAEKYMLSVSLRRDGSTVFAPNKRFGLFPAISAGWDLSKESFFSISAFQQLKLRASYGLAGVDNVKPWRWMESYGSGDQVFFGEATQKGIAYSGIVNQYMTWEKNRSTNFGLDTRFLNHFNASVEYWNTYSYDILADRLITLPTSFGGNLPPQNYGKATANGMELELGYNGSFGKLAWHVKGNLSYAVSKIKEQDFAENGQEVDNPNGRYTDVVRGLAATGLIRTEADLQALKDKYGNGNDFGKYNVYGRTPRLGDVNYEDISGPNGKPDGEINGYDRAILANHSSHPWSYGLGCGFSWKGISLDIFFQGATGGQDFMREPFGRNFIGAGSTLSYEFWKDSWSPDNVGAKYPAAVQDWDHPNTYDSKQWLFSKSYLRLKNVNLSYTLPNVFTNRLGIDKVQLFCMGTNLFTISSFKFYDPEAGSTMYYPQTRALTLGINVTL